MLVVGAIGLVQTPLAAYIKAQMPFPNDTKLPFQQH